MLGLRRRQAERHDNPNLGRDHHLVLQSVLQTLSELQVLVRLREEMA